MAEIENNRALSLYVHIPFCKAKCSYCDFLSFGGCDGYQQQEYVEALCNELSAYALLAGQCRVETIFIGGGTPSYIDAAWIEQIMDTIRSVFAVAESAEITIEGNPDSLTADKIKAYYRAGINRLSIGLQSANDDMLQRLGRVHTYDQFTAAFHCARQIGFENINVDIMSGLPGEGEAEYVDTLNRVTELKPEHISAYSLIVEEDTPLGGNAQLLKLLPDEELDRTLYAQTKSLLKSSGYDRYEISNYAKSGRECRHNIVYWTGGEYLGVGIGAASYLKVQSADGSIVPVRFHGIEDMASYIGNFSDRERRLPFDFEAGGDILAELFQSGYMDLYCSKRSDEIEEFMFLGLRLMRGVSKTEFQARFGVEMEKIYGRVLAKYRNSGLLIESGDRLYLSDKGIDVSNVIMAEFMM